jgi:CubicO group peptidase (beta-lactamase class C family)
MKRFSTTVFALTLFCALFVSSTLVFAQADAALTDSVRSLMKAFDKGETPGASIMVMQNNEIIFHEWFGMASLTHAIPFGPETRHNIGSTSKQFTGFAIALLASQGKLSLDDDIRTHIPELPDFGEVVAIRHMLSHTSGYREYLNLLAMTGMELGSPIKPGKVIEIVQRQPELQNVPGAEFNYNNTSFWLITVVIQRVTNVPFDKWMKDNVFEPLGMKNTMVRRNPGQVVPNRSVGYGPDFGGEYREISDLHGAMGAGGIYTTMGDLANWIRNMHEPKPEHKAAFEALLSPNSLNNGQSTNYGLGIFIGEYKGLKNINHGGADAAHRSMLMYFPEINAAVVTQSNLASFDGSITNKVVDLFFAEHLSEETAATVTTSDEESAEFVYNSADFDKLTGRYGLVVMPSFVLSFSRDGDRIFTQATGQPAIDIKATSDSTFSLVGVNAALTFHRNADGTADSLTLHQNGNHVAKKIRWTPSSEELTAYEGQYFSDEIETLYTLALVDGRLVMQNYFIADIRLSAADKDEFSAGFPFASVEFVRDESGEITGFKASNGRARDVFFGRK